MTSATTSSGTLKVYDGCEGATGAMGASGATIMIRRCSTCACSPIRSSRARWSGAYVALLVLQLNPMVRLDSMAVARLMLTWAAFYGVHAAAFFYGLIVLRQLLAVEVRSPGWISLRLLARVRHDRRVDERDRHVAEP